MKAVIGLLLVFIGLLIGYMVLTGKLPASTPGLAQEVAGPGVSSSGFGASSGKSGI